MQSSSAPGGSFCCVCRDEFGESPLECMDWGWLCLVCRKLIELECSMDDFEEVLR